MELARQGALSRQLEDAWGKFCRGFSERVTRLNIGSAFYNTVREVDMLGLRLDYVVSPSMGHSFVCTFGPIWYVIGYALRRYATSLVHQWCMKHEVGYTNYNGFSLVIMVERFLIRMQISIMVRDSCIVGHTVTQPVI